MAQITNDEFYALLTQWGRTVYADFTASSPDSCYRSINRWIRQLATERRVGELVFMKFQKRFFEKFVEAFIDGCIFTPLEPKFQVGTIKELNKVIEHMNTMFVLEDDVYERSLEKSLLEFSIHLCNQYTMWADFPDFSDGQSLVHSQSTQVAIKLQELLDNSRLFYTIGIKQIEKKMKKWIDNEGIDGPTFIMFEHKNNFFAEEFPSVFLSEEDQILYRRRGLLIACHE